MEEGVENVFGHVMTMPSMILFIYGNNDNIVQGCYYQYLTAGLHKFGFPIVSGLLRSPIAKPCRAENNSARVVSLKSRTSHL